MRHIVKELVAGILIIFVPLLFAGLSGSLWVSSSEAAVLKNVRFGTYDDFTRVVFEFDDPPNPPLFNVRASGQLDIAFADCQPDLVRKIPTKHFDRIIDVQLWMREEALITWVFFNFKHSRYKWFALSNPHRMVVDVFADTRYESPGEPSVDHNSRSPELTPSSEQAQPFLEPLEPAYTNLGTSPGPLDKLPPAPVKADPNFKNERLHRTDILPDVSQAALASVDNTVAPTQPDMRPLSAHSDLNLKKNASMYIPQYVLVIASIAITILILILLVLIMLVRNSWAAKNPQRLSSAEFIRIQDGRISLLNERIQEQLERYKTGS
jgi:hypothetical protein